jgi:DNA (cytosine-5)-methyltransferase 1
MVNGELIVDSFAGGGGASTGIEMALGVSPDIAINHDPEAIAMHAANHLCTRHYIEDVWKIDPADVCRSGPVGLMWLSPDCKHFSKAKGGKPVSKKIRGLAWLAIHWAKAVRPRVIFLENVEEFVTWGPVLPDGMPCKLRKGFTFRRFVSMLSKLGYAVDWRELKACDYGAPTTRKRLFLIARCDRRPIVWPEPTHGRGLLPYRTAAECIDFTRPCPSIFERERPLAPATLRRIARGIMRFVVNNPRPFIVPMQHENAPTSTDDPLQTVTTQGNKFNVVQPFVVPITHTGDDRVDSANDPLRTITSASRGELALATPFVTKFRTGSTGHKVDEPMHTICAGGDMKRDAGAAHAMGLVAPTLIQAGYGERPGQAPRSLDLQKPLGTIVAQGQKHALVSAFIAKHYGDTGQRPGSKADEPVNTITACDHNSLVTSNLVKLRGTSKDGQPVSDPLHTITANGRGGGHFAEVRAFLLKYYSTQQGGQDIDRPIDTITAEDRFGLVTVEGTDYAIVDIGMRMLTPRELFLAQGFPSDYIIDPLIDGKPLTKTAQVRMVGNSVVPQLAAAIVRANFFESTVAEPRQVYA